MSQNIKQLMNVRRDKRQFLIDNGVDPYNMANPQKQVRKVSFIEIPTDIKYVPRGTVRGRIVQIRKMGKSTFAHIQDDSGKAQIYAQRDVLGTDLYTIFKKIDLGDIIEVSGEVFNTQSGEPTLRVGDVDILSKSLRPLPDKFHGVKDIELTYRQRYLDLITNQESRNVFVNRSKIVGAIRRTLESLSFMEVETPMLHPIAGGANAKSFSTHYNALGEDMHLRIAPELHLKMLLVGGFEKIYEINRNFRNEGMSTKHNPEFTALEVYQSYTDYIEMMRLVEYIVSQASCAVSSEGLNGFTRISYSDLIKQELDIDYCEENFEEIHTRYENEIEPNLIEPTFVTNFPHQAMPPLCKRSEDDRFVEVFEFIWNGKEIGCGYSEENNPEVQRESFEAQEGETDEDFLLALEYGMPPAGGLGLGIDRLVMELLEVQSIKDVILFPQLKRKN
jgi:lysyl-tRNA synthetase, class II